MIALAFMSMIWSVDPAVSFRRSIAPAFSEPRRLWFWRPTYSWPKLLEILSTAFAIVVVLCFILCLLLPRYGRMTTLFPGAWRGVWFEKNALGDNMAVALHHLLRRGSTERQTSNVMTVNFSRLRCIGSKFT